MQRPRKSVFGIFIVVGLVAAAIFVIILFSGFSVGTLAPRPNNPFGPDEGPPRIIMLYGGNEYAGELRGYVYDRQQTITELPEVNRVNVTEISSEVVSVTKGSEIKFVIRGNPEPEAQPDSLAVSAYAEDGRPVTVLDPRTPQNDTYTIDKLQSGEEYVLSSVATWKPDAPDENEISGYVVYGYRISVINSVQ